MKVKPLFIGCCMVLWMIATVHAQPFPTIVVKAGTSLFHYFPVDIRYRYPEFITGKVFFLNGSQAESRLNYNLLTDEMQFIGTRGDTMNMTGKNTLDHIEIGDDQYYYDRGFLSLFAGNASLRIARKHYFKYLGSEQYGAYGTTSAVSSIDTYSSYIGNGSVTDLVVAEDLKFRETIEYYIAVGNEKFSPLTKSSLNNLFKEQKKVIKAYLKDHDVDLTDETDLLELFHFLNDLLSSSAAATVPHNRPRPSKTLPARPAFPVSFAA